MAKGFVYRGSERTADSLTRKSKEGSRDYDSCWKGGLTIFKPKEGENCVRVMPSTWDEPDWDLTIYSHYNIGADKARYLCPMKMKDEPCAVCDIRAKMKPGDEADELSPGKGAVCWVIDRDNMKAGPQLWSMPFTKVRNEIHTRSIDKKTRTPILVDDPEEGYDIVFHRKGTDQRTTYSAVELMRDPSPLSEDPKLQQRWLDYIADNPLPEVLNFFSYEHVEKVLLGQASSAREDDGDSGDEVDASPPTRSSRRQAAVEPEAEVDAPPARAGRRAAAAPAEDTDDDPPFDADKPQDSRAARRRALLDGDNEETDPDTGEVTEGRPSRARGEPVEEDSPVAQARRSLERLKPAARASRGR